MEPLKPNLGQFLNTIYDTEVNHHLDENKGPRTPLEISNTQDIEPGFENTNENPLKC